MSILLASPVVLACLLMAAHFLRGGHAGLMAASLTLPFLLLIRRPWVPWVLAAGLAFGTLEWLHTTVTLTQQRMAMDAPWQRMVLILGSVSAFTAISALAPFRNPLAGRFRHTRAERSHSTEDDS